MFFAVSLSICKNANTIKEKIIKFKTGNVSNKETVKFCQILITIFVSENNKEKYYTKPDSINSDSNILNAGMAAITETKDPIEKNKILRRTTIKCCSWWIRFNIFSKRTSGAFKASG